MLGISEIKNRVKADLALREIEPDCRFGEWEKFRHELSPPYVIFGLGTFTTGLTTGSPNDQIAPGPVRRTSATRVARVIASRVQVAQVWVCGDRPTADTEPAAWEEAQEVSTAALLHEVKVSIERVTVRVGRLTWGTGSWLQHEVEGLYGAVALDVFAIQLPVFDVTLDRRSPAGVAGTVTTNESAGSAVEVVAPKP